ncbi:MAG: hypothetical protein IKT08_09415 [Bacteroidales bacterium]|nr:hypothetical protein [Bacteroidales bacterium]
MSKCDEVLIKNRPTITVQVAQPKANQKRVAFDKGSLRHGGIRVGAQEAKLAELSRLYHLR